MKYCPKCGYQSTDENVFCHRCGGRLTAQPPQQTGGGAASQGAPSQAGAYYPPPPRENAAAPNTVRYVQIDTTTGKLADVSQSRKKRGSGAFVQGMIIALTAIAVVILMVAGSLFLSGQLSERAETGEDAFISSLPPVSSQTLPDTSSDVSSEAPLVSSKEENTVPQELRAETLRGKLKGSWTTKLPYKTMQLPVTFTFDDKGKCSCVIKALFVTKQFDGTYTMKDGGDCSITLVGMDEYMKEGDTLAGKVNFVSDNQFTFTFGNEMLTLDRAA